MWIGFDYFQLCTHISCPFPVCVCPQQLSGHHYMYLCWVFNYVWICIAHYFSFSVFLTVTCCLRKLQGNACGKWPLMHVCKKVLISYHNNVLYCGHNGQQSSLDCTYNYNTFKGRSTRQACAFKLLTFTSKIVLAVEWLDSQRCQIFASHRLTCPSTPAYECVQPAISL